LSGRWLNLIPLAFSDQPSDAVARTDLEPAMSRVDSNVSRRSALALGATTMAISSAGSVSAMASASGSLRDTPEASLQADLERYVSFGVHQSGSKGDLATGQWVGARLGAAGITVSRQAVTVPFFDEAVAQISVVGGGTFEGIGQHPIKTTEASGLLAPLALWRDARDTMNLNGKIAVVILPFGRHSSALQPNIAGPISAALGAGALGLVVVTDGPSGEALALNAQYAETPPTVPCIVVGSRGIKPLLDAAVVGAAATLKVEGIAGQRQAFNVVGRRPGKGRKLVLTTPLSGWFTCGAERGSGVAAFLAMAPWLAANYPDLDITTGGMTGHEFENLGSKEFNASVVGHDSKIDLWVHLGAAFAARDWHELGGGMLAPLPSMDSSHFMLAHPDFLPILQRTMHGVPGFEVPYPATVEAAAGEAKQILMDGHTRLIANFGSHRLHHARNDGANTTSGALIFQAYRGLQAAVQEVLG
jgi:hypothetical protein